MQSNSIYLQDHFIGKKMKVVSKDKVVIDITLMEIHSWGIVSEDCQGTRSLLPWHLINMVVDKMPAQEESNESAHN